MPRYDSEQFYPPAAVADVQLRNSPTGKVVSGVRMLLDTGADVTLLPVSRVQRLGISLDTEHRYELTGFDGQSSFSNSVVLDMVFFGNTFRGRYLLTTEDIGILGRDVLNHFALLLNGPALEWHREHPED